MFGIVLFVVIIFLPPFVFGVLGYAEDKPITEYERQKKQNEADVQYYLSHENDPDKSNLDKERMENGASMSQLQAAVDACLKLNHNTEWNDDYSCSQSRVRSENYIEKQSGTSSRIIFEDACNVYNQEMDEAYNTNMRLKLDKDLRADFSSGEAEDAGGLTPAKDDNEAWRKICRKDCRILVAY